MKPFTYNLDYVKEQSRRDLFKVVSLFAGGGGSSTGYRLAGGEVLAINEFIPAAQEVYARNYPDTYIFTQNIRQLTGEMISDHIGLKKGELDILDGSPPCSSYSDAGNKEKGWGKVKKYSDAEQRTDDLFFEFARILKDIQPKVFICENVKGITEGTSATLLGSEQYMLFDEHDDTIYHTLVNSGYRVRYKVLNAINYHVPQRRERTIFIGVRKDIKEKITFPTTKSGVIKLADAFDGVYNTPEDLAEADISTYKVYEHLTKMAIGASFHNTRLLRKASPEKAAFTVTASSSTRGGRCEHHWDNRKFTVKELIRICSFPEDYYLGEKYQNRVERLGRAVPPLMMKAIANHVYETILKKNIK